MRIWLADLTYDQQTIAADTIPTNVGYVASYLLHNAPNEHTVRLFKYPGKLASAIDEAQASGEYPEVVGLSNFIWNSRLSYKFAEKIKSLSPKTVVVFGGLHYPNESHKQQKWHEDHPRVDFHVYKEGERGFFDLIQKLGAHNLNVAVVKEGEVLGTHFLRKDGSLHGPDPAPRIEDLASFPSPYTEGLLDEFFDGRLMPILTTNRGCPFSCAFCTEGIKYYTKVNRSNLERVTAELNYMAKKIGALPAEQIQKNIYVSDSNFGMYKEDLEVCQVLKDLRDRTHWPQYILATTGKNSKERVLTAADILGGGLKLSGSVQSLDKEVQKNIRRENIKSDVLLAVAKAAGKVGADSYSEIILGLPGDSYTGHEYSLRTIINAGYDQVLAWQLIILPETDLAVDGNIEKFQMKCRYRALTKSYGIYPFKDGTHIACAEIEDVCVQGINLPFEDYVRARKLHLVINVFYNNRFFSGLLKLLDGCEVERYNLVQECMELLPTSNKLSQIFEQFINETRSELWDSKADLEKFVDQKENIERYLDGSYGANLIFKYRILAMLEAFSEVCSIAKRATENCLRAAGMYSPEVASFLEELIRFEQEVKRDVFTLDLQDTSLPYHFDILRFLAEDSIKPVTEYRFAVPKDIRFYRTEETNALVATNTKVFGTSIAGRYKQLTRTPLQKLYRSASYSSSPASR